MVFERRNRTLLDMVRSMMSLTDLPLSFWGYVSYELWFGKKQSCRFLKFGAVMLM